MALSAEDKCPREERADFKYQSHYVSGYLGLFIHVKNSTDRFTFVHQFERFVHIVQTHGVSNELLKTKLTRHVTVNYFWKLRAAFNTTESLLSLIHI